MPPTYRIGSQLAPESLFLMSVLLIAASLMLAACGGSAAPTAAPADAGRMPRPSLPSPRRLPAQCNSITCCGIPRSSRCTKHAPLTSPRPIPTSRSRSPSPVGATTGAPSRRGWLPATRPMCSPIPCGGWLCVALVRGGAQRICLGMPFHAQTHLSTALLI